MPVMETLRGARPAVDSPEVEELRDRTRRWCHVSGRLATAPVDPLAVEDVTLQPEHVSVLPRLELPAKPRQGSGVEEIVSVDTEHPRRRARVPLERRVRVSRSRRAAEQEVVELTRELTEDGGRSIVREMVECIDAIAECGDVANHALDENVFVSDPDGADDPNSACL